MRIEFQSTIITAVLPVPKSVLGTVQAQSTLVNKSHPSRHSANTREGRTEAEADSRWFQPKPGAEQNSPVRILRSCLSPFLTVIWAHTLTIYVDMDTDFCSKIHGKPVTPSALQDSFATPGSIPSAKRRTCLFDSPH